METSKKKRLDVFKAITRDLSPEFPSQEAKPILSIPCPTGQFSFFNSETGLKASSKPSTSADYLKKYSRVSIPQEVFTNYSHKFESFGHIVAQELNPPFVDVYYITAEACVIARDFLQSFDMGESHSIDSNSEYLTNFSNSPMLNISTEESSREECEERRKPKKRPLDEGEKTFYVINISNIRKGSDSRTTVMVKNIPNKYTQKMLLQTIDKKFVGTYDFLYLPIDFKVNTI